VGLNQRHTLTNYLPSYILIAIFLLLSPQTYANTCSESLKAKDNLTNYLAPIKNLNIELYNSLADASLENTDTIEGLKTALIVLKKTEAEYTNSYLNRGKNKKLSKAQVNYLVNKNTTKFPKVSESDFEDITEFYTSRLRRSFLEIAEEFKITFIKKSLNKLGLKPLNASEMSMLSEQIENLNRNTSLLSQKNLSTEGLVEMLENFKFYNASQALGILAAYKQFKTDGDFSQATQDILLASGFEWSDLERISLVFNGNFTDNIKDLKCCKMNCRDCTFGRRWTSAADN